MSDKKDKVIISEKLPNKVETTRIQELERQNRALQIEIACLKELRRLRREETRLEMKLSQESSTTSEETSN